MNLYRKGQKLGSRDLLVNDGSCRVEVFYQLRPPKDTNNGQQQTDNSSPCINVSSSTGLILYSSEKDEIVRTTKYVLTHQNLDTQGEFVTDFLKSDVLPSGGGGVNIIFNDIQ
ncbi:hypothetical protein I4U23_031096 [Adineta vaga]|nr:hypothetical protein I4U23_031096 [Adineta vaga]